MGFFELLFLALSLAMDAFAVSVCGSMAVASAERKKGAVRFGVWFGLFQAIMPVIGYYAVVSFKEYIVDYDHWLAFILLSYLGFNMIKESSDKCSIKKSYTIYEMFVLAVATSIDALAVGISLAFLNTNIWTASALTGIVTFIISFGGGIVGFKLGNAVGAKANVLGGIILIIIGIKILAEHTGII